MIENYLKRSKNERYNSKRIAREISRCGYIVWYNDLWLLNCVKLRPLSKWEESILEYKVKYYDDSVNHENDPLSIEVY